MPGVTSLSVLLLLLVVCPLDVAGHRRVGLGNGLLGFGYNACRISPCQNGGRCVDNPVGFGYRCICLPGFSGQNCQIGYNACRRNPCQNGGRCVDNRVGFGYRCICLPGFSGQNCQIGYNACRRNPCQNGGRCVDNPVGFGYRCICLPGFSGQNCQIGYNACRRNPCQNGGRCVDNRVGFGYSCICLPGFSGQNCQIGYNACRINPCMNGGSCIDNLLGFGYRCICSTGFSGQNCQINIDECASRPCSNNGTCVDQVNGFMCQCAEGFTGDTCNTNIDECASGPCNNNRTCVDQVNGFMCQCAEGFTGDICDTNIDECASGPCNNNGTCVDQVNGFICQCAEGFEGTTCDTDTDECASGPCQNNGTCVDQVNGYKCSCAQGFEGDNCDIGPPEGIQAMYIGDRSGTISVIDLATKRVTELFSIGNFVAAVNFDPVTQKVYWCTVNAQCYARDFNGSTPTLLFGNDAFIRDLQVDGNSTYYYFDIAARLWIKQDGQPPQILKNDVSYFTLDKPNRRVIYLDKTSVLRDAAGILSIQMNDSVTYMAWNPSDSLLYYIAYNREIRSIDLDTRETKTVIGDGFLNIGYPSALGDLIVFDGVRPGVLRKLYSVFTNGANLTLLGDAGADFPLRPFLFDASSLPASG